jgi:S1-C subfamily serine protease
MPDYSYTGEGVRIDGVSEGKAAKKAGILAGDILTSLGSHKVISVESYMQALAKFKKGDATQVVISRNGSLIKYDIVF